MAQAFTCDRCGAPIGQPTAPARKPTDPIPVAPRTVVVPLELPSTSGAAKEILVEFALGVAQDLCPMCFVAAVFALVVRPLAIKLQAAQLQGLVDAAHAVIKAQDPAVIAADVVPPTPAPVVTGSPDAAV